MRDLDARIDALHASVARLETLVERAATRAGPSAAAWTGFAATLAVVAGALLPWGVALGAPAAAVISVRRRLRWRRARTSA